MADAERKITVSQPFHEEDDLPPPPPPPPVPPRPFDYEGPMTLSSLPLPPPKETFSTFYQQRQKSELKRLYKHIHPSLQASLDDAVDDEIMQAVQAENTQAADAAYQGEVQSMRWIFENWTLDNIGDPHETKKLLDTEELKGGDVRSTSTMFEHIDSTQHMATKRQTSVRGDVRTSTWLFETQPLDALSKSKADEGELVEALLKEPIQSGDVRGARLLFESKPLSDLGRCNSIEDCSVLKLKSELQEQRGDVRKTLKLFETEPCCAIRDNSGNIHEIKSICREEINSGKLNTVRWLFETQPLDTINKGSDGVKIIRGISLEEGHREGVDQKRWMFETQSFDTITEVSGVDTFHGVDAGNAGEANVVNKKKLFEMQPRAALGKNSLEREAIIGGDVKSSMWLFETQPMQALSDSCKAARLKKISLSAEEQGEVKGKKLMFENVSFQKNTLFKEQEIEKGDVTGFKQLFETIPLSQIAQLEQQMAERQETNKAVMETSPLYAIKDSSGNLHKVTTVSREEFINGKVKNYKWMFETKPLDQLGDGKDVEIIKGITRQEDTTGDVKTAKWLFETQTIDGIHCKFNKTEQSSSAEKEPCKGDVKTCKWLFETQPMDMLYDKMKKTKDKDAVDTDVKSMSWLFESQPLDTIRDGEPNSLKLCSTKRDSVKPEVAVQTVKHLFETETLDRIKKESDAEQNLRCISQVNFQSGDVSRVKELFESQSLDEIGSEIMLTAEGQKQGEHVEKGSVHKVTWMFENCPMNHINRDQHEHGVSMEAVGVLETGDVQNKRFVFETSSLDKIQKEPTEEKSVSVKGVQIQKEDIVAGNIRNIMLQLLLKPTIKPQVTLLREVEKGQINTTVVELPVFESTTAANIERDRRIQNIAQMIDDLGDVKTTIGNLLATANNQRAATLCRVDENEKGNVNLYKSCIEKGDLHYLKSLHTEESEFEAACGLWVKERVETVQGGVQEAKRNLCQQKEQVERTVCDVLPGDVKNTKKVFSAEPFHLLTPEKTDENPAYQESDLNITAATDQSANDPEKQPEILLTDTSLPNPDPEQSVIESTPEGSSDEHLTYPVVDDNFGEVVNSTQVGEGSIQISTDESSPNSDKLLDAPDETGGNLSSETLFSSSAENPQDQTNFFDLSESSSLAGSSPLSASTETAAALPHDFSLMDTQLLSAEAEASLVMTDPPPDPDSALLSVKQEDNLDPFSGVNQTNDQIADFDIFGSSNDFFSQPILFDAPDPNGEEVSTNQFSAFPDDIFGVSHTSDSTALFPVQPNISNVSNSLNDLLGSDAPSTVAPPTQIDLFAGDIFATDAQLLAVAEPSDADVFGDNLLVSEGNNTEQKSESSSWMDDLLG
uniref:Xin actin binding repeat containing 1 n=1 Tax=Xiphophorus couchianus TaxID=32473 RepID=A0A3B5LLE6_9TELE